jgi:hypothetical protein
MEKKCKDMDLIGIIEDIHKSLSLELEVNWSRNGGVINM